jgi:hypothetical protein
VIVRFVDVGGFVDHHCLEVIVHFVDDVGGLVVHNCLELIVRSVDVGGLVDHHCLEVIVGNNHILTVMINKSTNINEVNNHL